MLARAHNWCHLGLGQIEHHRHLREKLILEELSDNSTVIWEEDFSNRLTDTFLFLQSHNPGSIYGPVCLPREWGSSGPIISDTNY